MQILPLSLNRSHRIKLVILALLLAVAGVRETDWAKRTLNLDGYWEDEARHRALALWEAEATLAELEAERLKADGSPAASILDAEIRSTRADAEELRRALDEARSRL